MTFPSILYEGGAAGARNAPRTAPDCFRDLNLDQVVEALTLAKAEYDLKPFFYDPLATTDAIQYRHEVMRELENEAVMGCVTSFADCMRLIREKLEQASKLHYKYQKQSWFLHAVETYCRAVCTLRDNIAQLQLSARGLLAFRDYVTAYAASERFTSLVTEADRLITGLGAVRYSILIRGSRFTVRRYDAEPNYSAQVTDSFRKFQQGAVKEYLVEFPESRHMNHIEAKVLDFVALLYPDLFASLDAFCAANQDFIDQALLSFDREVQFYVAFLEYMSPIKRAGLHFCYPEISAADKQVCARDTFDLALAAKLVGANIVTVPNDFELRGDERIFVVSGPNQGGKTTLARTFGQLHYLGRLGCPVPGRYARLFLFDALFTHFERGEAAEDLRGKLQDDLVRIHEILEQATSRSIVILNEIFTSTTFRDAVFLARKVMAEIIERDLLCVFVTFLAELSSVSEKTVSLVSTVVPDNPAVRTYKVVRRPADGRSYAVSIAEKYRLTYECLSIRLPEPRQQPAETVEIEGKPAAHKRPPANVS